LIHALERDYPYITAYEEFQDFNDAVKKVISKNNDEELLNLRNQLVTLYRDIDTNFLPQTYLNRNGQQLAGKNMELTQDLISLRNKIDPPQYEQAKPYPPKPPQ
jgi:hypothetical protein